MRRSLERLFDRYRTKGDLGALAVVFDRTARELLALAQHLVRDVDDAEDLVQSTFVTAIDRAQTYDGSKPLLPWLSGILAHHASNHIRDRLKRRAEDVQAVACTDRDPFSTAQCRELEASVVDALARMDERYRRVLCPYLSVGDTPDQIARRLGMAPGTVRAQIHRGLLRLRTMLPAGIGAGAIVVHGKGVDRVRAEVLRHGAAATSVAGQVTAGAAGGAAIIGGILAMKKVILFGAAALVAATGLLRRPSPLAPTGERAVQEVLRIEVVDGATREQRINGVRTPSMQRESVLDTGLESESESSGRLVIAVRVNGVAEEQLDGLSFELARRREQKAVLSMASIERQLVIADLNAQLQDIEARSIGSSSAGVDQDSVQREIEALRRERQGLGQPWVPVRGITVAELATSGTRMDAHDSPSARRSSAVASEPGAPGGAVFEIDASTLLQDESTSAGSEALRVSVSHDLYFDGTAEIELGPARAGNARAGQSVRLTTIVTLDPAAVLVGTVKVPTTARRNELFNSVKALERTLQAQQESHTNALEDGLSGEPRNQTPGDARRATEERLVELTMDLDQLESVVGSRASVGLFRPGDSKPVGQVVASGQGEFRFKLREEGQFTLVAVATGWTVEQLQIELGLRKEVRLPRDIELTQTDVLTGVIEDFGAFPRGGMPLVVTRVETALDRPIDWMGGDLIWSGGRVVLRRVITSSLADGSVAIRGLSPGHHRIGLSSNALCAFDKSRRESLAIDIQIPAVGAVLALPVSVLEIVLDVPVNSIKARRTELLLGAERRTVRIPGKAWLRPWQTRVFADPAQPTTLSFRAPGMVFESWTGVAPTRGDRQTVSIAGRYE